MGTSFWLRAGERWRERLELGAVTLTLLTSGLALTALRLAQ